MSSLRKYFNYLDKVSELGNKVANSLQNYIAARTAIRDYVIRADESQYAEVEQRIVVAIGALVEAEDLVEEETLESLNQFLDSLREWFAIAQQVHDGFVAYRESLHTKVLTNFSAITQAGHALLQVNAVTATGMINDVQTANVAMINYLLDGEHHLIEEAGRAFDAAKAEINELRRNSKDIPPTVQRFEECLNAYSDGFREAAGQRESAYKLFNENLAPLGTQIQSDFEQFHR